MYVETGKELRINRRIKHLYAPAFNSKKFLKKFLKKC